MPYGKSNKQIQDEKSGFKMKSGAEGPMHKNFPSVFKNVDGKVNVFGGKGTVNTNTKAGKKILKEINSIPTTSSSEKGRITVKHNPKAKYGQTPPSSKQVKKTVYKPGGGQYGTWAKIGKKIAKIGSKALMGGIINPFSSEDPRVTEQLSKANTKKINYKKTY